MHARLQHMSSGGEQRNRWSANKHGTHLDGPTLTVGDGNHKSKDELGLVDPIDNRDATMREWGATVNSDGTRSYFNGW